MALIWHWIGRRQGEDESLTFCFCPWFSGSHLVMFGPSNAGPRIWDFRVGENFMLWSKMCRGSSIISWITIPMVSEALYALQSRCSLYVLVKHTWTLLTTFGTGEEYEVWQLNKWRLVILHGFECSRLWFWPKFSVYINASTLGYCYSFMVLIVQVQIILWLVNSILSGA